MPVLVVLTTADGALADAWERQLPPGRTSLRLATQGLPAGTAPGFSAVVVLDAAAEGLLPSALARCPTIYVGEPRSRPFEQAKLAGRARAYLTYEASLTRLSEFIPLLEELAEKQSLLDLLTEKGRAAESARPAPPPPPPADALEGWSLLGGVVENLDVRERLIAEFRRALHYGLRVSHAVFFLREADGFRADRGGAFFPIDDPIVAYFESHPAVIDGTPGSIRIDPVAELMVRNCLALWGARLLVPVHDNGRLLGLIALGVRDDGRPYTELDQARAVTLARLLRCLLEKSAQLGRLNLMAEQVGLTAKYLPRTLALGPDESVPRQAPLIVHDLIGRARHTREICRASPTEEQPFRASAGVIAETGGVWAWWEDAEIEAREAAARRRGERRRLLRELTLTISHELGNSLVSLALLRQLEADRPLPLPLIETVRLDVAKIEALNQHLGLMQTLYEVEPAPVDVRELAQTLGASLGFRVEVGPDPVPLSIARSMVEFALRALIATMAENRPDHGLRQLALQVRSTGSGAERTALLAFRGRQLELEGVLPELPPEGAVPNQGRLGVFLAKEVLRLHHGEIHAGPGLEGTEILISLRSL